VQYNTIFFPERKNLNKRFLLGKKTKTRTTGHMVGLLNEVAYLVVRLKRMGTNGSKYFYKQKIFAIHAQSDLPHDNCYFHTTTYFSIPIPHSVLGYGRMTILN
jgi:hypothetical protein